MFTVKKRAIEKKQGRYCSVKCANIGRSTAEIVPCRNCGKPTKKYKWIIKKGGKLYCGNRCAAIGAGSDYRAKVHSEP
jgi:hypothetical protein